MEVPPREGAARGEQLTYAAYRVQKRLASDWHLNTARGNLSKRADRHIEPLQKGQRRSPAGTFAGTRQNPITCNFMESAAYIG
jgi:hypothetical protein